MRPTTCLRSEGERPPTSERHAIEALGRDGFTSQFKVIGPVLHSLGSDRTFAADDVVIRDHRRFEGASDPDDMSIIYALETADGTRGLLIDAFGVYADPAVGAFLDHVSRRRYARGS